MFVDITRNIVVTYTQQPIFRCPLRTGGHANNSNHIHSAMNPNIRKNRGSTLVEIMIVVVIIGLLAAMAIPAFNHVRKKSQMPAVENNLRQIASAANQYFLEKGVSEVELTVLVEDYMNGLEPAAQEEYPDLIAEGANIVVANGPDEGADVVWEQP